MGKLQLGQQCNKDKKEECGITSHRKSQWGMCHKIRVNGVIVASITTVDCLCGL